MSQNNSPTPLPVDAAELLRALWQEIFAGTGGIPSAARLNGTAAAVGAAARTAGLLPEHLVIGVKESWTPHAEVRSFVGRHDAERALAEVMSLCIREYFQAAAPAADGGDPATEG